MGIPSYFSYIVKNHDRIIKKIFELNKNIDNFYLDSNSIIYDALRLIENEYNGNDKKFEKSLLQNVCKKIDEYIQIIKPTKRVFIAFDGVAPIAKLEQQRTRRYKSYLLNKFKNTFEKQPDKWDKTAITPGTEFMKKLGIFIKKYYKNKEKKYSIKKFIISASDECGEGEHKLFEYIRKYEKEHKNEISMIYGLDADLIMLALNHLPVSRHIYLYRETPEFIKSLNKDLEPNEAYFLDIPQLSNIIKNDMTHCSDVSDKKENNKLYDYIFLCFFLGNDFLPHFPSVNLRTGGIFTLLSIYKNLFGNSNKRLTDGKNIYWVNVKKIVEYLSNCENKFLIKEYNDRKKFERRFYPSETTDEKMKKLDNLPIKERSMEKYINPIDKGWERRYYKTLFDIDINNYWRKKICINYLEGLEWTMKYYTTGCMDWNWSYDYHYPPLWSDLLKYIPSWDTTMIEKNASTAVEPLVQLAYVIPNNSLHLLPKQLRDDIFEKMLDKYPLNCEIKWAFCRYFWESHPELPFIDIEELTNLIRT
jgi:5'-3' exonuclease